MKPEPPDVQEIARFRESLYRFFSDCLLRPPTDHAVAAWQDPAWRAGLRRLLDLPSSDLLPPLDPDEREMLAAEHARLFLVPATQTCPVEFYHSAGRPLAEDGPYGRLLASAVAARDVYRSWKLRPEMETEEVPDHAATELRFMAMLVAMERQLRASGDEAQLASVWRAQASFLDQHILVWFPRWTATVQARALLPFYRCLVQLLIRFLELDRSTLGELAGA